MRDPILTAEHISISFGGLKPVNDFSMELSSGELVGLIGPNGAGKTTVFNLLSGVYHPDEGEIRLSGRRIDSMPPHEVVAEGIARTFQNIRLFKEMTVLDNVKVSMVPQAQYSFVDSLIRTPRFRRIEKEQDTHARELLELFGLGSVADELAENLPYGQQRKLEIARALGTNMKVLLLDEPAAGMNPTETAELRDSIDMIRNKFGIAILLIEHDMSFVMNICEKIMVLDFGQKIAEGTPDEIAADPRVIAAYLGEEETKEVLPDGDAGN